MDKAEVVVVITVRELEELIQESVLRTVKEVVPELVREVTAKPWMTKEEFMEMTGWSSRTLQNLRDTNQIPYSQHGHKILYPRKGILEFLENHKVK